MAFVRLLCTARKLKNLKEKLEFEKTAAYELSKKRPIKLSLRQKIRRKWIDLQRGFKKLLKKCNCFAGTGVERFFYKLAHDGSFSNFILKSILGFLGGFLLTYILFIFFVFQLNFTLYSATIFCSVLGTILTVGLAFSSRIRCIVFMTLPQFFSKKGRQALIAYALILTITGPAKNALTNMGILSESLACGQEQLKAAVRQIIDVIKKPFYAIKDAIKSVVKTVKEVVQKIKAILLKIKRIVLSILRVIKAAFQFLGKVINMCNKELGTPFQRCVRVFDSAIQDCNAKLGPFFSWICSITVLIKGVCYMVKIFDFVCMLVDFISDSVIGVVLRKIKNFVRHVKTMFYVRIKFSHSFHFETESSKSLKDIAAGMLTEIKQRAQRVVAFFDFANCAASLFFLFIIYRVVQYRYKFLTSERFDNKYITKDFVEIDMRRASMEKETILPLNHIERRKYITVSSKRLVHTERRQLSQSAVLLGTVTLKICIHMIIDYSLYWIMSLIRHYGRFQSKVEAPNVPTLHIEGNGLLADLLKSIVKAFQPMGVNMQIDTVPCLPNPIPPDMDRYIQIGTLLLLCWILTVFEPYGLRWRHWIMCYYKPRRGRERAVWLYNHILRSRSSFIKLARRQLRRKALGDKSIEKVTCKEYLRSRLHCKIFLLCLGSDAQTSCLLCGEVFREYENKKPIKCQTPNCNGVYCERCFHDLQNLCTICMSPIEYGDMSDISEEQDSSEDEPRFPKSKGPFWKRICGICKKKETEEEDDDDDNDDSECSSCCSEYSYSYQEDVDSKSLLPTRKRSFIDVEKQESPDYASMQSFEEEINVRLLAGSSTLCDLCGRKVSTCVDDWDDESTLIEFSTTSICEVCKKEKFMYHNTEMKKRYLHESDPRYQLKGAIEVMKKFYTDISKPLSLKPKNVTTLTMHLRDSDPEMDLLLLDEDKSKRQLVAKKEVNLLSSSVLSPDETLLIKQTKPQESSNNTKTTYNNNKCEVCRAIIPRPLLREHSLETSSLDSEIRALQRRKSQHKKFDVKYDVVSELSRKTSLDVFSEPNTTPKQESTHVVKNYDDSSPSDKTDISEPQTPRRANYPPSIPSHSIVNPCPNDKHTASSNVCHPCQCLQHKSVDEESSFISEYFNEEDKEDQNRIVKVLKETERKYEDYCKDSMSLRFRKFPYKYNAMSNVFRFVKNMVTKRKRGHARRRERPNVELRSFNYKKNKWDTLDDSSSSLSSSENYECLKTKKCYEDNKRIRGGGSEETSSETFLDVGQPATTDLYFEALESSSVISKESLVKNKYFCKEVSPSGVNTSLKSGISLIDILPGTSLTNSTISSLPYAVNQEDLTPTRDTTVSNPSSPQTNPLQIVSTTYFSQISNTEKGKETSGSSDIDYELQALILGKPPKKGKRLKRVEQENTLDPEDNNTYNKKLDDSKNKKHLEAATLSKTKEVEESEGVQADLAKPIPKEDRTKDHTRSADVLDNQIQEASTHKKQSKENSGELLQTEKSTQASTDARGNLKNTSKNITFAEDATDAARESDSLRLIYRDTDQGKQSEKNILHAKAPELADDVNQKMVQTETVGEMDKSGKIEQLQSTRHYFSAKNGEGTREYRDSGDGAYVCRRCKYRAEVKRRHKDRQSPPRHKGHHKKCKCCRCHCDCHLEDETLEYLESSEPHQPEYKKYYTSKKSYQKTDPHEKKHRDEFTPYKHLEEFSKRRHRKHEIDETPRCHKCGCIILSSSPNSETDVDDYVDLPYQKSSEFMVLVEELEKKLKARNKKRVRRTIREFEKKSRRNEGLEKPLLYDDESSSEEPILRKFCSSKRLEPREKSHSRCRTKTYASYSSGGRKKYHHSPRRSKHEKYEKEITNSPTASESLEVESDGRHRSLITKTHWQMDPTSGEWYKVSGVQRYRRSSSPRFDAPSYHQCKCCRENYAGTGHHCKKK